MDKIHFVLLGTIFIIAKRFSGSFRQRTDITVAAQPGNLTPLSARIYPGQRFYAANDNIYLFHFNRNSIKNQGDESFNPLF